MKILRKTPLRLGRLPLRFGLSRWMKTNRRLSRHRQRENRRDHLNYPDLKHLMARRSGCTRYLGIGGRQLSWVTAPSLLETRRRFHHPLCKSTG